MKARVKGMHEMGKRRHLTRRGLGLDTPLPDLQAAKLIRGMLDNGVPWAWQAHRVPACSRDPAGARKRFIRLDLPREAANPAMVDGTKRPAPGATRPGRAYPAPRHGSERGGPSAGPAGRALRGRCNHTGARCCPLSSPIRRRRSGPRAKAARLRPS